METTTYYLEKKTITKDSMSELSHCLMVKIIQNKTLKLDKSLCSSRKCSRFGGVWLRVKCVSMSMHLRLTEGFTIQHHGKGEIYIPLLWEQLQLASVNFKFKTHFATQVSHFPLYLLFK